MTLSAGMANHSIEVTKASGLPDIVSSAGTVEQRATNLTDRNGRDLGSVSSPTRLLRLAKRVDRPVAYPLGDAGARVS